MAGEGGGRARAPLASLLGVVVAMGAASCTSGPVLRTPTDDPASVSMSNVAHGSPRSVGSMTLCLSSPGTAAITDVALHEATGDIRVEAFGVRANPFERGLDAVGAVAGTLDEVGGEVDPWREEVTTVCPTTGRSADPAGAPSLDEFAVQVSWSSGDVAGGTALDVTYAVDGVEHTLLVPFGIWLCAATCPDGLGSPGTT